MPTANTTSDHLPCCMGIWLRTSNPVRISRNRCGSRSVVRSLAQFSSQFFSDGCFPPVGLCLHCQSEQGRWCSFNKNEVY
ncbi:hypothetical protein COCON_G00178400 [Conger conger]|uniref:Uncharacterized protein n=1 Tax=Conger conger TaxID=82655 RepID=A0A9Q1D5B8_CONCO|nr:hypothetical protein COCON_G00178400 [Conger conger]